MEPLLILPFDHRSSFAKDLLGYKGELDETQKRKVSELKEIVFEGFRRAVDSYKHKDYFGILVDEEYGLPVIMNAKDYGVKVAVPVEKSGQKIFDFEYGEQFGEHISKVSPDFVKALVRYNPGNIEDNKQQIHNLKQLSDYCGMHNKKLLFELLVPPTDADLKEAGSEEAYDNELRAKRTTAAIREIKEEIEVAIWKLEGFTAEQWPEVIGACNDDAGIIVLGRGADREKVKQWLVDGSKFDRIVGFAVGRTIFANPLKKYLDFVFNRDQAAEMIAANFATFVDLWAEHKKIEL